MKKRVGLVALLAIAGVIAAIAMSLASQSASAQQAPEPTSGHLVVSGLVEPRGMAIGPDGMIYVAEAGTGGDMAVGTGDNASKSGFTGRISKVDPATGARTTIADKLPSNVGGEGDAVGPAAVAFLGNQLYYVQTHAGTAYGFPATTPTGVYKVNSDGTVTLIADLGAFNIANPVNDIKNGTQQDIEIGGNPYGMVARDGALWISDGNQNQVDKVTPAGAITRITEFPGHPVTTGIAYKDGGPFFVGTLGQFPFNASDGTIRQVGYPSGSMTTVASGISSITGLAFGPDGNLYMVNFGDQTADPFSDPIPWTPFSGKLYRVNLATNTFTPLVGNFFTTTAIVFKGDTAYIANFGIEAPGLLPPGEIWAVDNVSTLPALAVSPTAVPASPTTAPAAATATPATGVTAPNTGTGPDGGSSSFTWAIALAGALGALALGAGIVRRRTR
jgi:sugar lactone lactonase YvrE